MSSRTKLAVLVAIVVIAVAAVIALNPGIFDKDSDQNTGHTFPDPIEEGDRDYPTATEAEESYANTIEALKSSLSDSSLSAGEMFECITTASAERLRMADYYAWVYLDYNENPSEFKDAYTAWSDFYTHLNDDYAVAMKESLSGPCAETVEKALKDNDVDPDTFRNYGEMTQEEKDFRQKETTLVAEYTTLVTEDYTMTYGGSTWTLDSIENSTTLSDRDKAILAWMLEEQQYGEAAEIYVELVQIRNDFAVLKGYDNYAEYAYKVVYGRDYTPTEAKSFSELVDVAKETYGKIYELMQSDSTMSSDNLAWMDDVEGDGFFDIVSPFIDSMGDEYAKLLDYMIEYDLIDICTDSGRQEGAYTQNLYIRNSAVIYVGEAGDGYRGYRTASTIVHEFGHAANFCLNPNYTSCLDIKEIHSQGLQALYCTSGLVEEGARALAAENLYSILTSTVEMPGLLTELELWAYETEAETDSLTGTQVHDKFVSILESHGYSSSVASYNGYLWAKVPHLFEKPHYYISYGTSAIGAIELFVEAVDDYNAAKEKYLDLVFQQGIDGYSEAVKKAGLANAFDADAVKAILEECVSALQRVKA